MNIYRLFSLSLTLSFLTACTSPTVPEQIDPDLLQLNADTPVVVQTKVSTLAGSGSFGYAEGSGQEAQFYHPSSIVQKPDGSFLLLDRFNHRIREISADGSTSTFWGNGLRGNKEGGPEEGRFNQAISIYLHSSGDLLIADAQNHTIRRLNNEGILSTFLGQGVDGYEEGQGTAAAFAWPSDMVEDNEGNLYITDRFNHAIRKVTPEGSVTTLAGNGEAGSDNGQGKDASFNEPMGLTLGPDNHLYVADSQNHLIRKVSLEGVVTTHAGSGQEGSRDDDKNRAEFRGPSSVAFDAEDRLLIVDRFNHRIRRIETDGKVRSVAGNGQPENKDGQGTEAAFSYPFDLLLDKAGHAFVADYGNHAIRKIKL